MSEEDLTSQLEEVEALAAIYLDDWTVEDDGTYSVLVKGEKQEMTLILTLPSTYPSSSPPFYQLSAPHLRGHVRAQLCNKLENIYLEHTGENILFMWIELLREYIQDSCNKQQDLNVSEVAPVTSSVNHDMPCPSICHGETITDRRSTFQAHVATISSENEVRRVIQELYKNKKIATATHNIYAYRIWVEDRGAWLQDCEDDGETHAGGRLLHLLEILGCRNILVVVSRWYGGILLGPDRFKHINNAARQSLEQAGLVTRSPSKKKPR